MPTYTYKCEAHGKFEKMCKMSEMTTTFPCPKCGESSQKQIDRPAVVFKGGGWCRPDPKIPDKFLKMSDAELDSELGLTNDANANA